MLGLVGFAVGFGIKGHKNESFKVIDAFHLETWFHIVGPLDFNKGVLYLLIATVLTIGIMVWVARHMQMRPGRLQVAVEWGYDLMKRLTRDNMDEQMTRKMVPARLHAVRVHPRHQPDRLHPAAGRLAEHVQAVRGAHPVLPDLCRGHERRRPAGARARRVHRVQRRRASVTTGSSAT